MTTPDLSPGELRVMKALWSLEQGSVADVRAELARRGQELAYTTVMTLLGRLATKGAVAVDKDREPFIYKAAHHRESVLRDRLRDFVREVFDGKADSLVLNLVESESLSADELRAIERKITEAEAAAPKPVKPRPDSARNSVARPDSARNSVPRPDSARNSVARKDKK